jgi:hypothetical protein
MNPTAALLEAERETVLAEAARTAARVPRYAAAGADETTARLDVLFETLLSAVESRDLTDVVDYARGLGTARSAAGYDLGEVQVAINALEEAVWLRIFESAPQPLVGEALRLVSTVLGAAKDALAQEYVEQAKAGPPAPDPSRLLRAL